MKSYKDVECFEKRNAVSTRIRFAMDRFELFL